MPPKKKSKKSASASNDANGIPSPLRPSSNAGDPIRTPEDLKSDASTPEMVVDEPTPEPPPAVVEIDPSVLAEQRKEKGNDFFKAKKYPDAIDSYSDAIRLKPSEPNYLTNRAAALMALKRFHSALADCQQAASLQASSPVPKTLVRLARCQLALGSPQDCISTLTRVAQVEPNNAAAASLRKQADSLQKHLDSFLKAKAAKDWGMARIAFDTAVRECEGDIPIQWRCWRVELEIVRKKWDDAAQSASDALRLDPNSPDVLALRGLVLFLTNRLPQCIQHLQSALRLDPDHKVARVLLRRVKEVERIKELGNVEFKAGRMDEAVAKYGEALEILGTKEEEGGGGMFRAVLLSNRATALLKLEKYAEALSDTTSSLEILPSSYKALRTQARIKLAMEDYEGAVRDFKESLAACGVEGNAKEESALKTELRKAEADMKRSKTKDYYKILGLPKMCSDSEIKKAYRRESLIHHPDKGGDEEKFKLVVEAHAVLSDAKRRERYDNGFDEDGQNESGGGGGGFGGMDQADLAEIFAQMGGGGGHPFFGGGGGGPSPFGGGGYSSYGGSRGGTSAYA